ncbi:MAG: permease-like cell division protein FtsX [Bacillota bacterium]
MSLNTLGYYWREALQSIFRNSWLSIASVGTVTVSLLIVGIFALLVVNANEFTRSLESGLEIRVILKDGQPGDSIKRIRADIEKMPGVSMVEFVSRDQALEEMKRNFKDRKDVLEGLQNDNPLPDAFRVRAYQADQIPDLAGNIESLTGVEQVIYGHGLVERLVSATRWIRLGGGVVLGILCLAAVFLISTTIRMSVFARRREIGIMILLGATNWFVRFPYLLEGMILGFLGAVLAGSVVYIGYISLVDYIGRNLPFIYPVTDQRTIFTVLGGMLVTGLVIGALGSSFSIRKFLKI